LIAVGHAVEVVNKAYKKYRELLGAVILKNNFLQ
jgi:hypothetical protein